MSKTLIENKSAMLKDLKKAVNSLVYSPSLAKQEAAFDALASLNNFLESFEVPKEVKSAKKPKATKPKATKPKATKPKASKPKATPKPKASKSPKPKASNSSSKTGRKAEIEALLSSGKKMKRTERSVLNKELFALLSAERRSSKKSKSKAVRRPKRTSADGLELTQAKDAIGVGKAKKTKAVALDGSQAMYLEPRKEVLVPEPKARKKAVLEVFTLLDGESPQDAVRRRRIEQEKEQSRLEAEALMSGAPDFDESPF
jgi:hypothetical protein